MSAVCRNVFGKCNNNFYIETTSKLNLLLNCKRNNPTIFNARHFNRRLSSCLNSTTRVRLTSSSTAVSKCFTSTGSRKNTSENTPWQVTKRYESQKASGTEDASTKKDLMEAKESPYAHLTLGEKVVEAGKDATYTGIIIIGLGVTGVMFYAIGRELFSSESSSGIYGKALKLCQKNDQLQAMLGEPIKGFGETTSRGRRRYVSHQEYLVNGVQHMQIRFYIEGPYAKGTVNLEAAQNDKGKYEYRYIVAELDGYPRRTVLVVDNT